MCHPFFLFIIIITTAAAATTIIPDQMSPFLSVWLDVAYHQQIHTVEFRGKNNNNKANDMISA